MEIISNFHCSKYSLQSMFLLRNCYFLTHYQNLNCQNGSFTLKEAIKGIYLFESIFQTAFPCSHLSSRKRWQIWSMVFYIKKTCNTFIFNKSFMYFVTNRGQTLFVTQRITVVISHVITKYYIRVLILKSCLHGKLTSFFFF